jgi:signal transduction histidine kinase
MRLSGGIGQPAKPRRRKPGHSKSHKKATAAARGRRPSVAQLQEQLNALTRELSEAREQQTATSDVLNVIRRSTFQLQPVLNTIVQTASRLCDAEFALIFMLREDQYHVVAANKASDAFVKHASEHPILPGRDSLVGRTALERKTIHLPDCLADPEYTLLDYQAIGKYRSMLGVPLLRESVPIGVIALVRTIVMPFTDKQIDLVKTFADEAVIAIENVRLFEAEQQRTRELSESLQQQTATAEVLERERDSKASANRRLAAQWARLRKVNAFKNEIVATLAHDLKNPLSVIVGRADMLMRMVDKGPVLADRLRKDIDQIRKAADQLGEMVNSLLSDARADALDITIRLETTDLSALIYDVAEANQPFAAKKQQSIVVLVPPAYPFLCDGDRIREVVDNLLSNAIKYSQIGGQIELALERRDDSALIRVKDHGAGLSPADLERVFGRFQRLSAKPTGNEISIGLGLSIVKRIVDLHKGSVVAESPGPGLGAVFTVILPNLAPHSLS